MEELQKKYLNTWALGNVGGAASEAFLGMFLLYFYNQVLGLEPFLCGLGIAVRRDYKETEDTLNRMIDEILEANKKVDEVKARLGIEEVYKSD